MHCVLKAITMFFLLNGSLLYEFHYFTDSTLRDGNVAINSNSYMNRTEDVLSVTVS